MRTRAQVIATGLALGLAAVTAAPAAAAEQTLNLRLIGDPNVRDGNTLTLLATNVPKGDLTLACLTFTFTGDLVDPGEGLTFTPDGSETEGPGFFNGGSDPLSTRTICSDDPTVLTEISDGNRAERFVIEAEPGSSFTVSSVSLTLTTA